MGGSKTIYGVMAAVAESLTGDGPRGEEDKVDCTK